MIGKKENEAQKSEFYLEVVRITDVSRRPFCMEKLKEIEVKVRNYANEKILKAAKFGYKK